MESVTLGDFAALLAFIAGIIASGGVIANITRKGVAKVVSDELEPVKGALKELQDTAIASELEDCKTSLVAFIGDINRGIELSPAELERLHETYDRYTKLGGNSYIHATIEKLKKEGKI